MINPDDQANGDRAGRDQSGDFDSEPLAQAYADGQLAISGRLMQASNATFLCELTPAQGDPIHCVYKPVAGERPLWDFPFGTLAEREVAAYALSRRAGFHVVPPTILIDGPLGRGSLQRWVDVDEEATDEMVTLVPPDEVPEGYFPVVEGLDQHEEPIAVIHADDARLRRMALFDVVINNADRKGGHILVARAGGWGERRVWGVDHGVCLNEEPKLRTLLWGWAGEPLSDGELDLVEQVIADAGESVADLVTVDEVAALESRCRTLLRTGVFPDPHGSWPSIPWPPF